MDENEMSTKGYWDRREQRLNEEVTAAKAFAQSPEGKRDALWRKAEAMQAAHTDSGAYTDAEIAAAYKAYDDVKAATAPKSGWTKEQTIERRAAWNARVRAGEFGKIGSGKTDFRALRTAERAQGWTAEDLKKAVKAHGL